MLMPRAQAQAPPAWPMPLLPQVPTIAEAGVPGYSAEPWDGFAVPAGTPDAVMDRLMAALKASLATPEVAEMFVAPVGELKPVP